MPKQSPKKKRSSSLLNSPKGKNAEEKLSWEQRFDELYAFNAQNGHSNVYTLDAQNKSLGQWVKWER
eukprot:8688108-Ditylum_brightwellii.AAC.1